MTVSARYWTNWRLFGVGAAALVATLFIIANAHLIFVSFASRSDCVLNSNTEGAATYRAAKPSC